MIAPSEEAREESASLAEKPGGGGATLASLAGTEGGSATPAPLVDEAPANNATPEPTVKDPGGDSRASRTPVPFYKIANDDGTTSWQPYVRTPRSEKDGAADVSATVDDRPRGKHSLARAKKGNPDHSTAPKPQTSQQPELREFAPKPGMATPAHHPMQPELRKLAPRPVTATQVQAPPSAPRSTPSGSHIWCSGCQTYRPHGDYSRSQEAFGMVKGGYKTCTSCHRRLRKIKMSDSMYARHYQGAGEAEDDEKEQVEKEQVEEEEVED